jgi:hypothetical protein
VDEEIYIWRFEQGGEEGNGHTDPLGMSVWFVKVCSDEGGPRITGR